MVKKKKGTAVEKMKNCSAFEKSSLIFGIGIGLYLQHKFRIHGFLDFKTPLWKQFLRTIFFFVIFSNFRDILKYFIGASITTKYLSFLLQPVLIFFLFPLFSHLTSFGIFFGDVNQKVD